MVAQVDSTTTMIVAVWVTDVFALDSAVKVTLSWVVTLLGGV